jgi:hypothetical protein
VNGYARKPITFSGPSIFDNSTKTAYLPTITATWTPTGSLSFQTVFLIADGAATGATGTIAALFVEPSVILRLTGQPYQSDWSLNDR